MTDSPETADDLPELPRHALTIEQIDILIEQNAAIQRQNTEMVELGRRQDGRGRRLFLLAAISIVIVVAVTVTIQISTHKQSADNGAAIDTVKSNTESIERLVKRFDAATGKEATERSNERLRVAITKIVCGGSANAQQLADALADAGQIEPIIITCPEGG